jgi:hypothetical protein
METIIFFTHTANLHIIIFPIKASFKVLFVAAFPLAYYKWFALPTPGYIAAFTCAHAMFTDVSLTAFTFR